MPMKEIYDTVNGQMIGYSKAGVQKDFLTDALGSVTAEVDQTGNTKTFDGRYKPYGADLSSSGTRGNYGWVGSWGYRETGLKVSTQYVRARHYNYVTGMWTTEDPLWPKQVAYNYTQNRATMFIDPSGLKIRINDCSCSKCVNGKPQPVPNYHPIADAVDKACLFLNHCTSNPLCILDVASCIVGCGKRTFAEAYSMLMGMGNTCRPNGPDAEVGCGGGPCYFPGAGYAQKNPFPGCNINVCIDHKTEWCGRKCGDFTSYANCDTPIIFIEIPGSDLAWSILHELAHCNGLEADNIPFISTDEDKERGNCIASCILDKTLWI